MCSSKGAAPEAEPWHNGTMASASLLINIPTFRAGLCRLRCRRRLWLRHRVWCVQTPAAWYRPCDTSPPDTDINQPPQHHTHSAPSMSTSNTSQSWSFVKPALSVISRAWLLSAVITSEKWQRHEFWVRIWKPCLLFENPYRLLIQRTHGQLQCRSKYV